MVDGGTKSGDGILFNRGDECRKCKSTDVDPNKVKTRKCYDLSKGEPGECGPGRYTGYECKPKSPKP